MKSVYDTFSNQINEMNEDLMNEVEIIERGNDKEIDIMKYRYEKMKEEMKKTYYMIRKSHLL